MEEILKSNLLEYEKSTFLFDLTKHKSGVKYIKVKQTIEGSDICHELKINSSVLGDIIYMLTCYQKEIKQTPINNGKSYFSEVKQKAIVDRYLKGVPIEDLSLQFDCSIQIIEQVLFNKEIEIVNNKPPRQSKKFRYKRKS